MAENIEKSIYYFPIQEKLIKVSSTNYRNFFLNFHKIYG